jgi:SAM-dependent methyltransferase
MQLRARAMARLRGWLCPSATDEFWDPRTVKLPGKGALNNYRMQEQHIFCKLRPTTQRCLQIGVPNWTEEKFGPQWVSVDLFDKRPCIDYQMDVCHMDQFEDASFDAVWCNAVLEHVRDPFGAARELARVTKPGGEIWIEVPFVQPYHPTGILHTHGGDFWRFTPEGLRELFPDFESLALGSIDEGGILLHGRKKPKR